MRHRALLATTVDVQLALGRRIRILREDLRLSQDQLAKALGLSQRYISELERGTKTPSLDTLVRIAHIGLHIPIADLFHYVDRVVAD